MMQPGWYHAEGDPPGTQRYWDGELWQGEPTFVSAAPIAPGAGGAPRAAGYYPEQSQATTALVLAILSIVICSLLAPVAYVIGNNEVKAIDAGRRDPTNRGTAQAGRIIGLVLSLLMVVGILAFVGLLVATSL